MQIGLDRRFTFYPYIMYTNYAAATILSLAALGHLIRVVLGRDLVIGAWAAPVWLSVVALIVAGYLGVQLWMRK